MCRESSQCQAGWATLGALHASPHLLGSQVPGPHSQPCIGEDCCKVVSFQYHEVYTTAEQLHVQEDGDKDAPPTAKGCLADVRVRPDAFAAVHTVCKQVCCVAGNGTC